MSSIRRTRARDSTSPATLIKVAFGGEATNPATVSGRLHAERVESFAVTL
jgi:hypothetical protein